MMNAWLFGGRFSARAALANVFSELPNSKISGQETAPPRCYGLLKYPAERFLLVTDVATANMLTEKLHGGS